MYYKPITVQYYRADCVSWVSRLNLSDLQIGFTNVLSEWNAFVCSRFTIESNIFFTKVSNLVLRKD